MIQFLARTAQDFLGQFEFGNLIADSLQKGGSSRVVPRHRDFAMNPDNAPVLGQKAIVPLEWFRQGNRAGEFRVPPATVFLIMKSYNYLLILKTAFG